MPTNMGPPRQPCASSSSCKRKQPDDENELLLKGGVIRGDNFENEYENLDNDEDSEDDEATSSRKKAEYESILKAQEPPTISRDGDIKITPFNLVEELEEGELDQAGNFVFRRGSPTDDEKNDTWAESIDWAAVERRELEAEEKRQQQSEMDEEKMNTEKETEPVEKDRLTCYKQLLRVMRSDETVQKTIRRLGNDVPKRQPINNKSRTKQSRQPTPTDLVKVAEAREKLDLMIELAHHLLEDGDTDIYQKSYEDLEEAIN